MKPKLSVVLATRNEEENIAKCLESVKDIAWEIVIFDEYSTDRTTEIARKFGARVFLTKHEPIFHKTKQKALEKARGDWILQLDADEVVSRKLGKEIIKVINQKDEEILGRKIKNKRLHSLLTEHLEKIQKRSGKIGDDSKEIAAFMIPRKNYFLGRPIIHAGVYPDGVIRLVKKGKAHFPAKSVHEQIEVDGKVCFLYSDLEHYDSPTFSKYFSRFNRYTNLHADYLRDKNTPSNYFYLFYFSFIKPFFNFLNLYIRHKGFLDGFRGFLWSLFSSLHFPVSYFKYWEKYNR